MRGNTRVAQRSVRGRAGVIGIEIRLRLFEPKSRGCSIDAALVPHHVGFRGLQIVHTSQSTVDPVASPRWGKTSRLAASGHSWAIGAPRAAGAATPAKWSTPCGSRALSVNGLPYE